MRTSQWLSSASLPLGFDAEATFETTCTQLHVGDRLYLLSDGIYEAPSSAGELWGRTRLQDTLQDHRDVPLERSVERTIAVAHQWLGGHIFPDDVALLGLELHEDPHQVGTEL